MKDVWGSEHIAPPILTSILRGGEWSASRPGHFTPEETVLSTHLMGGWVDPKDGLEPVGN
jgi:hypothetical protein